MALLLQDLKYAVRMLGRNPGFTVVVVLTLALGIGATTAIYSVAYGVLLRPLPYPSPDRIIQVWQVGDRGQRMQVADPTFEEWREQSRSFAALAQYSSSATTVLGGAEPVRAVAATVCRDFFTVVGVTPQRGRSFADGSRSNEVEPGAIISHGFWQRQMGGDPSLSGRTLKVFDQVLPVVGVMPPEFDFPANSDIWVPRELWPRLPSRTAHNWRVLGRLAEDVTLDQAQAEMSGIGRRQKQQYGEDIWLTDVALVRLHEQMVGNVRPALVILLGAVGFLLLVACANVLNMLLAQAATRQKELAVRAAMGANRWHLARQFLTESLLLATAGGALGVLVAWWGGTALLGISPGRLPRIQEVIVDLPVLLVVLGITLVAAAVLGLSTALRFSGRQLQASLAAGGRAQIGALHGERVRSGLVVLQTALTLVLLVGTGLLGRSFLRYIETDLGFRTGEAVVVSFTHPRQTDDDGFARMAQFHERLLEQLGRAPGVDQAGGINAFPLMEGFTNGMFLIVQPHETVNDFEDFGRLAKEPSRTGEAEFRIASEGYFRALEIPLVRGRLFGPRDTADAPHVAIISQSLARQRWPDEDPIGKMIQFGNMDGDLRPFTIIGIVADVRDHGPASEPPPTFYGYYRQRPRATHNFSIVLHGRATSAQLTALARGTVRQLNPELAIRVRTMDEILASSVADRRFSLFLLGVLGAAALLLATIGIYGLTAYSVAQRTPEMGVRLALGAQPADVLRLVLGRGLRLILIGTVCGLLGAYALTGLLSNLLFGVSPTDPASFAAMAAVLLAIALVASYIPARRAMKVDPIVALRAE
jgi:putative ABC transport system permease protein